MNTLLAASAGFFFATSIAGWLCAHVGKVKATQEQQRAHYLQLQWTQAVHANRQLFAANQKLREQIEEMGFEQGGELPGDDWKNGGSPN